jgi:hypothetical protein
MNKGSINHQWLFLSKYCPLSNLSNKEYLSSGIWNNRVGNRKTFSYSLRAFHFFGMTNALPPFFNDRMLLLIKALTFRITVCTLGLFNNLHNIRYRLLCSYYPLKQYLKCKAFSKIILLTFTSA